MDLMKIHPELRKVFRIIPPLPFHRDIFVRLNNWLLKLAPVRKSINGVNLQQQTLSQAQVRIYRPQRWSSGAGLLWIHGGGLITGRAAQDDRTCSRLARKLGLTVFSVDYRLAPRYPFPAALDDCHEAWLWLLEQAHAFGVDPARIAIGGQSAGGGLAAGLAQKILDQGGVQPAAQVLFCPMLDDRTAAREELDALNHRIWNNKSNRAGWSAYLGQRMGAIVAPPYAAPARRDKLAGLPPTWIGIGDIDLFFGESQEYAERLGAAGVRCELHIAAGAPHAFETIAPTSTLARALFAHNTRFLRDTLGITDPQPVFLPSTASR